MQLQLFKKLFYIDRISLIVLFLAIYIGFVVAVFSKNYMKGDSHYRKFFRNLFILVFAIGLIATADHIVLFLVAWATTSWLLTKLMVHKESWRAAKESGKVCKGYFTFGFILISLGFGALYLQTGLTSLQQIINYEFTKKMILVPLLLILSGTAVQTAIWPFHKWLISSLNSPTPVSAIMHAGVINGGGFLISRLAPLFFIIPEVLNVVFILGFITTLIGTIWKLMQNDIKRTLACSTMSQMGFMMMQCGLGLFAAAIAHLCWHGMFKAYLFLSSGSSAQETKPDLGIKPKLTSILIAIACGMVASYTFSLASHISLFVNDTGLVLVAISFTVGAQLSLTILQNKPVEKAVSALFATALSGFVYGLGVYLFEQLLGSTNLMVPQKLNFLHYSALTILIAGWLVVSFIRYLDKKINVPNWIMAFYVKALNSSQPLPKTITTNRKGYMYV